MMIFLFLAKALCIYFLHLLKAKDILPFVFHKIQNYGKHTSMFLVQDQTGNLGLRTKLQPGVILSFWFS